MCCAEDIKSKNNAQSMMPHADSIYHIYIWTPCTTMSDPCEQSGMVHSIIEKTYLIFEICVIHRKQCVYAFTFRNAER